MLTYERQAWDQGWSKVVGIDEAGRGPLAGPVVAAAVFCEKSFLITEENIQFAKLTDSKLLTEKQREAFFDLLSKSTEVHIGVGLASVEEIDEINVLNATHTAMFRAVEALPLKAKFALVDGRPVPNLPCPSLSIVKGDQKSLLVAAASVIAKVTRDRLMLEMDRQYPAYGFAKHKGYGTKKHLAALIQYGPANCHRRTFRPVRDMICA